MYSIRTLSWLFKIYVQSIKDTHVYTHTSLINTAVKSCKTAVVTIQMEENIQIGE